MEIEFTLNGKLTYEVITDDTTLFQLLRRKGCYSVKCGCETENCGLCTVLVNGKSRLTCSFLAARANGCEVVTLEGVEQEAKEFGAYLAAEGAEQCGFCSPGLILNVLAMEKEETALNDQGIKEYLAGNLCRCSGYMGQLRAVKNYLSRGGKRDEL
ncbi:(2Fe-2S)-binding protein [Lacrimispora saccharolytica]|uniref:(2Fe-2S)-binding domain protein n=1 Tax=Lacrimispora saccharolytica (strain ATCC 35040 / DSM 2544 / NRCC 2533 / WM1) TaxID=610130 RepID=D9R581_LACSW|nr:2Fe-2S iron-sulfur cluster-binding protein [Lacrimispora saccharolytica]ADL03287.1 (2Fe-2S)-binding domain protein [[Clostridium] saccharolyticum WM1]QRV18547.1 2Fe-2S iron-sulfur cluster binding domain-containing protein [Lacrimispora saccharolytica]